MQITEFQNRLKELTDIDIFYNEPMKNHTTFKIGGPADIFIAVKSRLCLKKVVLLCKQYAVPYTIVGAGSNLLVSDKGIRGVVIKYVSKATETDGSIIYADSGITLSALSKFALSNSLTGLEFAGGIPGLLGGAVYMNAGAYGGEMKDVILESEYLDTDGEIKTFTKEEHDFGYRHSIYTGTDKFILGAKLKLNHGDKEEILKTMNELLKRRNDKQPLNFPSAGSVFKRPEGYFAGKLIEDSNLKGYSVGGAKVSEKHAGFIINTGDATASDVRKLVEHIRETVLKNFNVELVCEIKMIGEF